MSILRERLWKLTVAIGSVDGEVEEVNVRWGFRALVLMV